MPNWFAPVVTNVTLASTAKKVIEFDPNRAVISFAARITTPVQTAGGIMLSPTFDANRQGFMTICLPAVYLQAGSPAPLTFHACKQFSYQQIGALVNSEWYAKFFDGPTGADLTITTWRFFG
jgi:hypothetical protein